jgi:hypothetical protein
MRKLFWAVVLYALLNLLIGGAAGGLLPLSMAQAAPAGFAPPAAIGALNAACTNTNTSCSGTANSSLEYAGNGNTLTAPAANSDAMVYVFGTYTGVTLNFEMTPDGVNYFPRLCMRMDLNATALQDFPANSIFRAYNCGMVGTARVRVRVAAIASGTVNVIIQGAYNSGPNISELAMSATDPCFNPAIAKSSKPINVTGATAVQLVGVLAGKPIAVCGFSLTIQGSATTNGTAQFEYGTQVTNPCDTGTTVLTGAFAGNITASVPTWVGSVYSGTNFATPASQQLCLVATGTTISIQGYVTYIQRAVSD